MTPTMCPRCGSHADRCECAELRREAYAEAAEYHRVRASDESDVGWSHILAAEHFEALARKPGPL